MTQKEAIIEALKHLGGKANLNDIYRFAYTLADFSGSKDWKATIRWYLQKEIDVFRSSKRGWWELVSYQEDIACRNQRIKELEEDNARLKNVRTEDDFVKKFETRDSSMDGSNNFSVDVQKLKKEKKQDA